MGTLGKSFHSETSIKSKMTKLLILFSASSGSIIREIRIKTSNCADCGMTFLGELSVKVCGQGMPPALCCVTPNLDNREENFTEGKTDIFSGVDLKECYNFDMGNVEQTSDFGITLYHALTDGGQFDWAQVLLSDNKVLQCEFSRFLDGADYEAGMNCQITM